MEFAFSGVLALTDVASRGLAIAGSGLMIVFGVLILISLFITALPHMIAVLERVLPAPDHSHADHARLGAEHPESQMPDDAVIAAIGFVLHTEIRKQAGN